MDLKKKLEYYRNPGQTENRLVKKQAPSIPPSLKALLEHFDARLIAEPHAPVLQRTSTFVCEKFNNPISLKRLSRQQYLAPIDLQQCLFFDLETTGLSGGTGTYPFLLGFGYFENGMFKIIQYFLPDFGRDYFVFKEIEPLLARKQILVSYNGKSYDLPLLKSRAIMNRLNIDFDRLQHIDLLHLARRVWKDSQERCDLNSVEEFQLGLSREVDIHGGLIPQAYLNFLNTGVVHEMIATIEHNVQDIYSLAKLLLRLAEVEADPETLRDEQALQRLAHIAFELQDFDYFERVETALERLGKTEVPSVQFLKSIFFKKRKEWEKAVSIWQKLIGNKAYMFKALEELAKFYEHQAKNYQKALEYCEKALSYFRVFEQLNPYSLDLSIKSNFSRRKERLRSKLS